MKTNLRKLGNSTGAIIPLSALQISGLGLGDELEVDAIDGEIVIRKAGPVYTLDQMLKGVTPTMVELDEEETTWLGSTTGLEQIHG